MSIAKTTDTLNDRTVARMRQTLDRLKEQGRFPAEGQDRGHRYEGGAFLVYLTNLGVDGFQISQEWYVPESMDSDDGSLGGFALPRRPGTERRVVRLEAATVSGLRDILDSHGE